MGCGNISCSGLGYLELGRVCSQDDIGLCFIDGLTEVVKQDGLSLDKLIGSQITDKRKIGLGYVSYNAIPPPHTGRFSPLRIGLSHTSLPEFVEPSVEGYGVKTIEVVTQTSSVKISKPIKENNDAPLIEDWESEGEDKVESPPKIERKTVKPSVDNVEVDMPKQNDKPARRLVKYAKMYRTQRPRDNQRKWNNLKSHQLGSNFIMYNKACYAYGSFNHLYARCKYHQRERMVNGTNHSRVNHSANIVPKAVFTRHGLKPINTVRPVNTKSTRRNLMEGMLHLGDEVKENRVLVVKPYFKTLYELFKGRTHVFSFMRPFGCHVTILNTIYYLGKLDRKSDEGFFVGYSTNSKAFRVYNTRTRKVEENLHINFLENKPIILGNGPKRLFNIDALTKLMNYVPVIAGTNSNDFAGKGAIFDAGQSSIETGPSQDYILIPLWNDGLLFNSSSKDSDGDNKDNDGLCKESEIDNQERPNAKNSTKDVNTAGPSINTASSNINTASPTVNTVRLNDDLFGADNDVRSLDGVEVDIRNISTTYPVPTTPNTRIHKDHSLNNVIGDMQSSVQTRRMTVTTDEQLFISAIYEEKTHEDLHTCLFACFLSQEEPKRITNALKDPAWVEAMQEELLGLLKKKALIMMKSLPPVARIKAIRLFLAYASFIGFLVYQMDIKSAFMYGRIKEEVYMCQPPGFEDTDYLDKVYKVEKALYGLHQPPRACSMRELTFFLWLQVKQKSDGIFISQDKSVNEILRKFKYADVKPINTPMDKEKALLKDSDGDDVDIHLYRRSTTNMVEFDIGQEDDKVRALKWFSVISKPLSVIYIISIALVKLSHYRKRTKPRILIDLYSSHQSQMANLELCDKQNMVAFLKKPQGSEDFHQIVDFLNASHIRTLDNGKIEINTTVDGQDKTINKASVRRHLQLVDADGTSTLPTTKIFKQLALMCYVTDTEKLIFQKGHFSP
uniref:Uncharacterized protein n=1 Tax=Tanacetum cinerariifolium TaxID=118510 RepID=A0A6L2KNG0_TANCI|nr:hypothetical protein [Tanacetum cinerariifolium]